MNWLDQKILSMEIAQVELEAQGYDPKKARKAIQIWHQSETALIEWIKKNEITPFHWANSDYWWDAESIRHPQKHEHEPEVCARHLLRTWSDLMKRTKIPIRDFIETSMFMGVVPKIPPHKVLRHNRK